MKTWLFVMLTVVVAYPLPGQIINPIHYSYYQNNLDPSTVFVEGNYAYVTNTYANSVEIIDISDPANPVHKSTISDGDGGALLQNPVSIFVSGNYAYVASSTSDALEIIDVSNRSAPFHLASIIDGTNGAKLSYPRSVFVSGSYAYVASEGSDALEIVDISTPSSPQHISSLSDGQGGAALSSPSVVSVSGTSAYVLSLGSPAVEIVDISTPSTPIHQASVITNLATGPYISDANSMFVSGTFLYLAGSYNLQIIDISNPSLPVFAGIGNIGHSANSVFVVGNFAYISCQYGLAASLLEIMDVGNPALPVHKGSLERGIASKFVTVSGDYIYTAWDYGIAVAKFIKPPSISSFAPNQAIPGTSVTITGSNFSTVPSNNIVSFNGGLGTVTASSPTSITVTVPTSASTGHISVTVNGLGGTSSQYFIRPSISALPICEGGSNNLYVLTYSTGATSYSVTNDTGSATISGNVLSAISAGYVYVTATVAADGTYNAITFTDRVIVNAKPTITISSIPSLCQYASSVSIPYTASTNSPTVYRIDWATIPDLNQSTLTASPLVSNTYSALGTPGTYIGTLYVSNGTCESSGTAVSLTVNSLPSISLTYLPPGINAALCSGITSGSMPYSSVTGSPDQYRIHWYSGAMTDVGLTNLPGSSVPVTGVPTTPGNYQGTMYVRNSSTSCENSGNGLLVVVNAIPTATPGTIPSVCQGTPSSTLTYSGVGGSPNQYRIDWGVAANTAGLADVSLTSLPASPITVSGLPAAAGTYSGRFYVKNATTGCESVGDSINVTITARPTITPGAIPSVCSGTTNSTIPYSATTSSPNQYRIDWNTAANTAGLTDISLTTLPASPITISGLPSASATYSGTLYVKNSTTGCESSGVSVSVTVNPIPSITLGTIPSQCSGTTTGTIPYSGVTGSPNQYRIDWNGAANSAGLADASLTALPTSPISISGLPTAAATYSGTLYVKNSTTGCESAGAAISVTVNPKPSAFISTGSLVICSGSSTTLTSTSGSSYNWSTGATTQSITVYSAGTFSVTVTNAYGCSRTSPSVSTWVDNSQGSITQSGDLCLDGIVYLTAGAGTYYSWTSQTISVTQAGTYYVTYTNENGCYLSASATVTMDPNCKEFGFRVSSDISQAPVMDHNYNFGIYPNPASDQILIVLSAPAEQECSVEMYDVLGRLSKTDVIEKGVKEKNIRVDNLEAGIYVVNIQDNKRMRQRKMIIQRK